MYLPISYRSSREPIPAMRWFAVLLTTLLAQLTATLALAGMHFVTAAVALTIALTCALYGCRTRPAGL